ncbi:hypothetical protein THAOC_23100 [Thalassiosira oceanica]|uniref:Uncharacterized protein n=1 Tax=Thalassiosira oceanica TaxID=159749 RepID=K0SE29_THAOC|nr:hypothetical protein THAOC_23100 [Thalassiosira oceanica]|eukprot:EJK56917.1 hypothetical protein THAOC_23100 [Thalassiosira oceanica]
MAASASAAATMTELLGTVPDCAWENVSSFAAPCDCYNIALASKRFFRPVSISSDAPERRGGQKPRRKSKRQKPAGGAPPLLLATRMLRVSLEHNLERVLEHSRSGITLESLKKLGELPDGSAVIAGSTMVQACLGVLWGEGGEKTFRDGKSDVDIFCSAKAAPAVRSWLVDKSDCMFVGLRDSYVSLESSDLLYSVDTNIHHVEHWGSISENLVREDNYSYGKEEESPPLLAMPKTLNTTRRSLGTASNARVDTLIGSSRMVSILLSWVGIDQNKAYDVKPKSGGDLPFDFDGEGDIDLVVGRLKAKSGNKKVTPSDLLSDFDLEICKCSFDGKKFHIANPHNTFSGKTQMEPKRRAVVSSYAAHFSPPANKYLSGAEASTHTSAVIRKVRVDVRSTPFYGLLDLAASLPNRYDPDAFFGRGSINNDPIVQVKVGANIQFHNFVVKLIDRLKKYQSRGIEVLNAPAVAKDKRESRPTDGRHSPSQVQTPPDIVIRHFTYKLPTTPQPMASFETSAHQAQARLGPGCQIAQISAKQWGAAMEDEVAVRVHAVSPLPLGIGREDGCEGKGLQTQKGSKAP